MIYCEKCPLIDYCNSYNKARENNESSYHPQNVVRARDWDCPLAALIKSEAKEK